ncbi:unnamed protein product [Symbiodinium microadriaticum]|nr:unnamed protein product [Symbiodinium microadriaticum]
MLTCGRSLQWQQAQSLLQCMQLQPADVMTCNALMGTYQKSAEWRQTLAFFASLRDAACMMDAWSFSAASAACEVGGCSGTQLQILEEAEATAVGCFDPLGGEKTTTSMFPSYGRRQQSV